MQQMAEIIVGFLFLPVTLFIIIPIIMLCGWSLFRLTLPLWQRKPEGEQTEEDTVQIIEPI